MILKDLIFTIKPLSFDEVLEYIVKNAQKDARKTFIVTINPEILMIARKDKSYEEVLKSADLALADGVGVILAGKMFGKSFSGRVHGVDLVERLCEEVSKKPITVGFLGGRENVAEKTAECLIKKYPGLKVAFAISEWPEVSGAEVADKIFETARAEKGFSEPSSSPANSRFENFASSPRHILNLKSSIINHKLSCDILFVAFGSPKQEKWIYKNLPDIDVKVAMGVGGAFDFISGRVRRAPVWLRNLGLEWLFRLIRQPWRIKRQLSLPKFVILVLRERFFSSRI